MLFFQAWCLLLLYDLLSISCRFETIHSIVKQWKVSNRAADHDTLAGVITAINYACIWYPKQALCLQRSFVTAYLLRRKGIQAQIVLGAQQLPFRAHAWIEVDGLAVNERSNVQATYTVWERC